MSLSSSLRVVVVALVVSSGTAAFAQPTGSASDGDARASFQLGQTAFEQGRYQDALVLFQQAYDLSGRAQLLYNIGQAADRVRDDQRALAAFERFLRDVPDSPQHVSTRARVDVLRAEIAEDEARESAAAEAAVAREAAPVTVDAPLESTSSGPSATTGFVIAGVGAGALAVGATFLALGVRDRHAVEDASFGTSYASVRDAYDRGPARVTVGAILVGVGAAGATVGMVFALRGLGNDDESPTALTLRVAPNGAVLTGNF